MTTAHITAWQHEGGVGFVWYADPNETLAAYDREKQACDANKEFRWACATTLLEVSSEDAAEAEISAYLQRVPFGSLPRYYAPYLNPYTVWVEVGQHWQGFRPKMLHVWAESHEGTDLILAVKLRMMELFDADEFLHVFGGGDARFRITYAFAGHLHDLTWDETSVFSGTISCEDVKAAYMEWVEVTPD